MRTPFYGADYFVKVTFNGFQFRNEGDNTEPRDDDTLYPDGWAFGRNPGDGTDVEMKLELWDEDEEIFDDDNDHSDINPASGRDLNFKVNLATGAITGDVTGTCGETLISSGKEDDRSTIEFWVLLPNNRPVANAGDDRSVHVGTSLTLDSSQSTDADGTINEYAWTLVSSPEGSGGCSQAISRRLRPTKSATTSLN